MADRFTEQVRLTQGVALKDSNGDPQPQLGTGGAAHVYGFARNIVVQAAGAYSATEVLGFICTAPGDADWTIDPVGGASVGGIDAATFTAGQIYPIHADAITVGTNGEAVLFIPDA